MNLTIEEIYANTPRVFRVVGDVTVAQLEAVQGVKRAGLAANNKIVVQVYHSNDPKAVRQRILDL